MTDGEAPPCRHHASCLMLDGATEATHAARNSLEGRPVSSIGRPNWRQIGTSIQDSVLVSLDEGAVEA